MEMVLDERCEREKVLLEDFTPAAETRRGLAPKSATRLRRGRAKRNWLASHVIFLGKGMADGISEKISVRIFSAFSPSRFLTAPRTCPLGVSRISNASSCTPWDRANPWAAGVQLPSPSLAAESLGPIASETELSDLEATPMINRASRRGGPRA